MGVTFDKDKNILMFVLEGENSAREAEKAFRDAFADAGSEQRYAVLVDASSSHRNRDLSEVSALAEMLLSHREHFGKRCALVINDQRPMAMELERRLAGFSLREKIEFGLFSDLESAKYWVSGNE